MKIGDYVRTKKDGIGRIISFLYQEDDECCFIELSNRRTGIKRFNIIKSSQDITDLIEPQDLMYIDIDNGWAGGIIVPRVAETMNELKEYIDNFKNKKCTLVGIVTHEQLHSIVYKVGEGYE